MAMRSFFHRFARDENGGAAEYALVLPLAVLILLGIIDSGRYMWEVSRVEKATQAGARLAAVTAMIPQGVANYSYSITGGQQQGSPVSAAAFPGVTCTGTTTGVNCSWLGSPTSAYALDPSAAAFDQIYDRMVQFLPGLDPADVQVDYTHSGLGFAGDPSGPDVSPIITVRVLNAQFTPLTSWILGTWGMPEAPYSISQEDGIGTCFEEFPGANASACDLS